VDLKKKRQKDKNDAQMNHKKLGKYHRKDFLNEGVRLKRKKIKKFLKQK
jgi:hypothetical protein